MGTTISYTLKNDSTYTLTVEEKYSRGGSVSSNDIKANGSHSVNLKTKSKGCYLGLIYSIKSGSGQKLKFYVGAESPESGKNTVFAKAGVSGVIDVMTPRRIYERCVGNKISSSSDTVKDSKGNEFKIYVSFGSGNNCSAKFSQIT